MGKGSFLRSVEKLDGKRKRKEVNFFEEELEEEEEIERKRRKKDRPYKDEGKEKEGGKAKKDESFEGGGKKKEEGGNAQPDSQREKLVQERQIKQIEKKIQRKNNRELSKAKKITGKKLEKSKPRKVFEEETIAELENSLRIHLASFDRDIDAVKEESELEKSKLLFEIEKNEMEIKGLTKRGEELDEEIIEKQRIEKEKFNILERHVKEIQEKKLLKDEAVEKKNVDLENLRKQLKELETRKKDISKKNNERIKKKNALVFVPEEPKKSEDNNTKTANSLTLYEKYQIGDFAKKSANQTETIDYFGKMGISLTRSNVSNYQNDWEKFVKNGGKLEDVDRNKKRQSGGGRHKWSELNSDVVNELKKWGELFRSKGKQLSKEIVTEKLKQIYIAKNMKMSKNEAALRKHAEIVVKQLGWKFCTSGHKDYRSMNSNELKASVNEWKKNIELIRSTTGYCVVFNTDESGVQVLKQTNKTFVVSRNDNGQIVKNTNGRRQHTVTFGIMILLLSGKPVFSKKVGMNVVLCSPGCTDIKPSFRRDKLSVSDELLLRDVRISQTDSGKTTAEIYSQFVVDMFRVMPSIIINELKRLGIAGEKTEESLKKDFRFFLMDDSVGQHLKSIDLIDSELKTFGFLRFDRIAVMKGLTDWCQPLDLCFNARFKQICDQKGRMEVFNREEDLIMTSSGKNFKLPSQRECVLRFKNSFDQVEEKSVCSSFFNCGLGPEGIQASTWYEIYQFVKSKDRDLTEIEKDEIFLFDSQHQQSKTADSDTGDGVDVIEIIPNCVCGKRVGIVRKCSDCKNHFCENKVNGEQLCGFFQEHHCGNTSSCIECQFKEP